MDQRKLFHSFPEEYCRLQCQNNSFQSLYLSLSPSLPTMILQNRRITSRSCPSTEWGSTDVFYPNVASMRNPGSVPPSEDRILTSLPQTSLISMITSMESTASRRSYCDFLQQSHISHTNVLEEVLNLVDLDDFDNTL